MKINKYILLWSDKNSKTISAPLVCNAATACLVSLNICNKVRTLLSVLSARDFLMYKLISYTVYINFKTHVRLSQQCPNCTHSVIPCFACYYDKLNRFLFGLYWTAWISTPPLRSRYTARYEWGCSPCMHCSWHSDVDVYTFILYDWFTVP